MQCSDDAVRHLATVKDCAQELISTVQGMVTVAAVDCDEDANKKLCGKYGVKGFPTIKVSLRYTILKYMCCKVEHVLGNADASVCLQAVPLHAYMLCCSYSRLWQRQTPTLARWTRAPQTTKVGQGHLQSPSVGPHVASLVSGQLCRPVSGLSHKTMNRLACPLSSMQALM